MATPQELLPDAEDNDQLPSGDTTKELYRREETFTTDKKVTNAHVSKIPSLCLRKFDKSSAETITKTKKETGKKIHSLIPVRTTSESKTPQKNQMKVNNRHPSSPLQDTLEIQFLDNRRKFLSLHAELSQKQRPLINMYRSLRRTKAELEKMGKKVAVDDLKIVSLKTEDGMEDDSTSEIALELKNIFYNTLSACDDVCKKYLSKHEHVMEMINNMSKCVPDPSSLQEELANLKKEEILTTQMLQTVITDNKNKMTNLIEKWQKAKIISDPVNARIEELEKTIKNQQKSLDEAENNLNFTVRKHEAKKFQNDEIINELTDKVNKLEEELQKEKKSSHENSTKTQNLKNVISGMETKIKVTKKRTVEACEKLNQLQEEITHREARWIQDKDNLKKCGASLEKKLAKEGKQLLDIKYLINIILKLVCEIVMPSKFNEML